MLASARLGVPDSARGVGRARHEVHGLPVDVDTPDGSVVAVVRAQTLAVYREPYVRLLVFGRREQQVSISVVLDLSDRSFVSL